MFWTLCETVGARGVTCNVILKFQKKHDLLVLKENMGQVGTTVDKTIYSEGKVDSGNVLCNQYCGV